MKNLFVRKKLALLSLLSMLAYGMLIMNSFADGWDSFLLGFNEGSSSQNNESFFLNIRQKEGYASFPDSTENIKTKEKIKIRYQVAQASVSRVVKENNSYTTLNVIFNVLIFISIVLIIYIPIQFFRLMSSLMSEVIFNDKNIKIMRKIGFALLSYYALNYVFNHIHLLINKTQFEFANYALQKETTDIVLLLMGLVVLLFAEVLARGSKIQEEQDLTI